jgi:hypothetical protein
MTKKIYNPFLPSYEYIPDAEPYVFNNRIYIFGSHDRFNGKTFCMNNYVSWSAPIDDLSDWRYEGIIYDKHQDPLIKKETNYMYAPDVQKGIDGKYYLYYFFDFSGIISVAVCNEPAGKYEFYGHIKYLDGTYLGKAKKDPFMFDPGVLVDDDHRVFIYAGFKPKLLTRLFLIGRGKLDVFVTELEKDMITVKSNPQKLIIKSNNNSKDAFTHGFFEASSIRKIDKTYYFIYSSKLNHELCYATADNPIGPYTYGGTIISNADIFYKSNDKTHPNFYYGNNHGSIVRILDQWYVFYHRQTNRHEYSRQACAEKIFFDQEGHIDQVEMTSNGLSKRPLCGKGKYPAHIACNLYYKNGAGSYSPLVIFKSYRKHPYLTQTGIDRENDPNQYIANIRNGTTIGYKYFSFNNITKISVEVSGHGNGTIEIYTDLSNMPIAAIHIMTKGERSTFETNMFSLNTRSPLFFKYKGKGSINLLSFTLDT